MSEDKKPYDVGYKKPPKDHQFKKGEPSKNPKGRKKGVRNFATLIRGVLQQQIIVIDKGVRRRMTTQEVIVQQVVAKAMKGDLRALEQIFKFNPRVRGEDLVKQAENTVEAWLDSMTSEELEDLMESLQSQTTANEERNRKAKEEARQAKNDPPKP